MSQNCEAEITYKMILRDPDNSDICSPNGPKAYVVVVMDEEGVEIPTSPVITCEYTGRTLLVKVKHWYSGNSCWSKVVVEDKNAPTLTCEPVDIWCNQNAAPTNEGGVVPVPTMVDACAESCQTLTLTYEDSNTIFYDCENIENGIVGTIDRTWMACDNLDNCRTCVQKISIRIPSFDDIEKPADLTLSCGECDPTDLNCTGMPTIAGGNLADSLCNLQIDYTDATTDQLCEGSYTIMRKWAIQNTCTEETQFYTQQIKIVDQTSPLIICADSTTIVATPHQTPKSCLANVTIPAATITDNCSAVENIHVITKVYKIDSVGKRWLMASEETNGGFEMETAFGHYEVYYQATDDCGNVVNNLDNACTIIIKDETPPTPICNAITKLTLDSDGKGLIYAQSFDSGSYDNCCIESYLVRRSDDSDADFSKYVEFTCADVGVASLTVLLQITDCHGNSSTCEIEVIVDGNQPPSSIVCADNLTVSCSDSLSLETIQNTLLTAPTVEQDCGSGNTTADVAIKEDFRNQCGVGAVIFEWTVRNGSGNALATCEQLVAFVDDTPLVVTFPDDFMGDACENSMDSMPTDLTGIVLIEGLDCEMVEVLHSDEIVDSTGGCSVINRRWTVTNLCDDSNAFEYIQRIELQDTTPPTIECNGEFFDICLDGGECSKSFIVEGVDVSDCSEIVSVRADWTFTPADACQGDIQTGSVEMAEAGFVTPDFGPGQLWINFYATDICGNEAGCNRDYTIKDCEAPEIICLPGITLNLDSSGIVEVWSNDFHQEVLDNCSDCYEEEDYIFSFGPDTTQTVRFYGCDELGVKTAQIWVTDPYGNQNFCAVTFNVKGADICAILGQDTTSTPPPASTANINGRIVLENGEALENVSVMANNHLAEMMDQQMTDQSGNYGFEFQRSANVRIQPSKNDDVLNGVTTYDILQMRKHILGYEELASPYQLIAADINRSNAITTADIVALRKVILQVNENFENNTAWRFVRADHQFADPKNPFGETIPESATIAELTQEMQVDFVAIKIGDLNGNAIGSSRLKAAHVEARHNPKTAFEIADKTLATNGVESITFALPQTDIQALQLTLHFDPSLVDIIHIPANDQVSITNFGTQFLQRGVLTLSWEAPTNTNEPLSFQLKVKAKRAVAVSELFSISSQFTPAVAYDGTGKAYDLDLSVATSAYDFTLLQNQPNPFQQSTTIRFTLPAKSQGKLTIYNRTGQTLSTIERSFSKGINEVQLRDVQQVGLLYYRLQTDFGTRTKKMVKMQ
ncbi:MAG: T9SS type A sorting domain-containing protein [Bacteroidota bacterium]